MVCLSSYPVGSIIQYPLEQGLTVEIEIFEDVFVPSKWASFFAKYIHVDATDDVLDVGTGSGILAITAMKKGARSVMAVDTSQEAIYAANVNAEHNGVDISTACGNVFDIHHSLPGYDVILANLPQERVHPEYGSDMSDIMRQTFATGKTFAESALYQFLRDARVLMHNDTRLYVIVNSCAFHQETLAYITQNFSAQLLGVEQTPCKEFVGMYEDWYSKLNKQGDIQIFQKFNHYYSWSYIFCLQL